MLTQQSDDKNELCIHFSGSTVSLMLSDIFFILFFCQVDYERERGLRFCWRDRDGFFSDVILNCFAQTAR